MLKDPFATDEEAWTEADFFSDEEEVIELPPGSAGWQAFTDSNPSRQGSRNSQPMQSFGTLYSHPNRSSVSVRSSRSSLFREPTPPYTISDLKIKFESEDGQHVWIEPASLFVEDSQLFYNLVQQDIGEEILNPDPLCRLSNLQRLPAHQVQRGFGERLKYQLVGVTPFDFESLLIGLRPKLGQEIPYERLCPLLVLSTEWGFTSIRSYAIKALSEQDDLPIPRILLARRARVPEWLPGADQTLATRLAPLTKYESTVLGPEATLCISGVQCKVQDRRMSLIEGPRPNTLLGKWFLLHPGCWLALSAAWKAVLSNPVYRSTARFAGPAQAMFDALKDQRPLCASCQPRTAITTWLDLAADERLAKGILQTKIGVTVERWISESADD